MCGIAGIFLREPAATVEVRQIRSMCDQITHRGPDDEGVFASGSVGLGMRRLSIIDLAGGHQPMHTDDGRLTLVFNGEIYNYRELRGNLESKGCRFKTSSDTEVILHAYAEYGVDCLHLLNGMFTVAIWDASRQELFVARDRLGIKPLYLFDDGASVRFASEIKALLVDRSVPRTLDEEALDYFLRYGYVTAPATLFRHVRQLPPAHYLLSGRGSTVIRRYWDVEYGEEPEVSEDEWADRVLETLREAVKRQLVSDVPLGAFLSGGLDSGSIVALMSEITRDQVSTYSIGFTGRDAFHNELDDARFVAEKFGTRHHEILVRPDATTLIPQLVHHLDQPLADSSFVVTYLVAQLARETVKVILSGVGGDELFGGYRRYLGPRLEEAYDLVPRAVRRTIASASSLMLVDRGSTIGNYARLGRSFLTGDGLDPYSRYERSVELLPTERVRTLCPATIGNGHSSLFAERRAWFEAQHQRDPVMQMMYLDLHTSLPESLLMLTDKMTMATSLEARVPFLDHELVELAARIPSRLKVRGTRLRYVQKRAMRRHLPKHVMTKRKRGFGCPVGDWFRHELRPLLRDVLASDRLSAQGLFDARAVEAAMTAHESRREDYSDLLLALVTFQLWHDEWMN
jgi:asparagine synthase (glutamine-hydrolysing)